MGRATEVEGGGAPEADRTRALYERFAGQIYTFCLHRLGSREEAEDAVQTTFLNAFRGLRRGIVPEAESAWLFKIAENVCLTRHRSAWRRGRVEAPSDLQAFQDVTPARERDDDELIPLGDALAAMPETQQRAILLREWQGLSYREIADEMGVSQSAVETLIFRARRSLANALEAPWEERPARRVGRRAFDLGSLLAGVKGLLAGGTAAKVAVVAAAAVTGTAAVAVAERSQGSPSPRSVEAGVGAARAPDSSLVRPFLAPPAGLADGARPRAGGADGRARGAARRNAAAGAPSSWSAGASGAGSIGKHAGPPETHPAAPPQSQRPKTPPGQAKEPRTPATPPAPSARRAAPASAERPKPKKPKPKAEKPKPERPTAETPLPERPSPQRPPANEPKPEKPKGEQPVPPPAAPPPPAQNAEPEPKDKPEKGE